MRQRFLEWVGTAQWTPVQMPLRATPEGLTMTDILDRARGALHAQPFSMLLGTELMHTGTNELTLCLPIRDELRQQHGFVHGGVISYLADNALTFAGALSLGPKVVTGEYKINYLRPVMNGTLIARAKVVYAGRHQATCQCNVYVMDGQREKLVAVAQGTINRISENGEHEPAG
ncbi:hypothetical protein R75461_00655 [Paraburkholderia nemoris]|jgi:uncharacterized protein (TIGR00369 family)|uniref:Medium/long-chain acyl-CoA thioesterase YigI n=2 Tax=Paraburkholderia TaxID=1822464 RepID=A0A6J5A7F5_9BURK|nr:hypothetical protein LMG24238_01457 [Paraburkholderia sediminicola]CAE6701779.1 hypothetical protein R75461_00655 [Paraburkholderia nemoris]CAE6714842.1 hypothetical protein R69776_01262 [Paraburkholderia nemoris]CAE6717525.1 hypothetical protein R75777_01429 [Paraburkholderia nemoris]CAE6741398.1 hypothetical protein LMG22931_02690 [Paraburkholderia nemoris]